MGIDLIIAAIRLEHRSVPLVWVFVVDISAVVVRGHLAPDHVSAG